jgi:hypothetical protein
MARDINMPITISDIDIPDSRREVNTAAVKRLADSIDKIGLRHPITVREKGDRYILVAGRHRLKAYRKMGIEHIPATICKMTHDDARLWEIAENLHRAELTKLERDDNIAEWIRITEKLTQSASVSGGRGNEGGVRAASRDLGVELTDAQRAVKVASLSDEAKDAARGTNVENNRSALLDAASKPTVAEQVKEIQRRIVPPGAKIIKLADDPLNDAEAAEKQVATLMSAWNKAGAVAREEFLCRIDRPVMDQRYA